MSKKMRSNILLLITAAIWGSSFVAQKSGMDYIEPFTYNGIRTLIGGLAFRVSKIKLLRSLIESRGPDKLLFLYKYPRSEICLLFRFRTAKCG